jgi:hypothetical protein
MRFRVPVIRRMILGDRPVQVVLLILSQCRAVGVTNFVCLKKKGDRTRTKAKLDNLFYKALVKKQTNKNGKRVPGVFSSEDQSTISISPFQVSSCRALLFSGKKTEFSGTLALW